MSFKMVGKKFRCYRSNVQEVKGEKVRVMATGKIYKIDPNSGANINPEKVKGTRAEKKAAKKQKRTVREIRTVLAADRVEAIQQGPI